MTGHPVTKAHQQRDTVHLLRTYPDHAPRAGDSHYHLFEQAKRRLKKAGKWACVISNEDCAGPVSLHHDLIEFAYANDVDLDRLNELLGLHLDHEEFLAFIEGPGALEPLCHVHHTGVLAVHRIPAADWTIVRVHKAGTHPIVIERAAA